MENLELVKKQIKKEWMKFKKEHTQSEQPAVQTFKNINESLVKAETRNWTGAEFELTEKWTKDQYLKLENDNFQQNAVVIKTRVKRYVTAHATLVMNIRQMEKRQFTINCGKSEERRSTIKNEFTSELFTVLRTEENSYGELIIRYSV